MTMLVDQKVWDLAGHFLDDYVPVNDKTRVELQRELSQEIQSIVEWFIDQKGFQ